MGSRSSVTTYDDLRGAISSQYRSLSGRLQQIAQFALDNPDDMALETVAVIADRANVQPSAMIRFAKTFGFDGFTEMQRIFRARLVERTPHYRERIRQLQAEANHSLDDPSSVLDHFVEAGINALQNLHEELSNGKLAEALRVLRKARTIHVVGQRRAFAVAVYLAYAFAQLGRSCHLIDNVGGMFVQQAQEVGKGDALVAISFHPYATETVDVAQRAAQAGVPVIAITDSPLSPLSPLSAAAFEVEDGEVKGFRSLSAIMALAVTLVVALGQSLESSARRAPGQRNAPPARSATQPE